MKSLYEVLVKQNIKKNDNPDNTVTFEEIIRFMACLDDKNRDIATLNKEWYEIYREIKSNTDNNEKIFKSNFNSVAEFKKFCLSGNNRKELLEITSCEKWKDGYDVTFSFVNDYMPKFTIEYISDNDPIKQIHNFIYQ